MSASRRREVSREEGKGKAPAETRARPGGRSAHVAKRREDLLDAAIRTIRRLGPTTSMDDIAAEAGITRPILYRYFGDRGGLVNAVAERYSSQMFDVLRQAIERAAAAAPAAFTDPAPVARDMIGAIFTFVESDPNLYRFLVNRALFEEPGAHVPLQGFVDVISRHLAVVIGELLRETGRDSGAAEPWAFSIVGMVFFASDWWLRRGVLTRDRIVTYLTELVVDGIGGHGRAHAEARPSLGAGLRDAARSAALDVVDAAAGAVSSTIRLVPKGPTT